MYYTSYFLKTSSFKKEKEKEKDTHAKHRSTTSKVKKTIIMPLFIFPYISSTVMIN